MGKMSGRLNTPGHRIRFSGSDRSYPTCQSSRHVVEDHDKHMPGAIKVLHLVPGAIKTKMPGATRYHLSFCGQQTFCQEDILSGPP